MALLGNRSVLHKSPGRFLSGTIASIERSNYNKPGMAAGRFMALSAYAAMPYGYVPAQGAWHPARKGGAVSSTNNARLVFDATGTGSLGKNASGSASIAFEAMGTGGLISSASGSAAVTIGATGNIFASKATDGTAAITIGATGTITALGHTGGSSGVTLGASWTPYAVGWLSGTTEESGLTVAGITNSVWNAVLANYNTAGTAGKALATASSGGVDYSALAAAVWTHAIESGLTAEQIVRLIAAALAGTSEKTGSTIVFKGLDGTTDRIIGSFDAEGNRTGAVLNGG